MAQVFFNHLPEFTSTSIGTMAERGPVHPVW